MRAQVIENVAPLAANAIFTSGTRDMFLVGYDFGVAFAYFTAQVDSDQAGSVEIDQSTDKIVWAALGSPTDYTAASGVLSVSALPTMRYTRVKFTNSTTLQTRFNVTTGVDQA